MVVPLIGYLDRFSARPGERIAVKVSSQLDRAIPRRPGADHPRRRQPGRAGPQDSKSCRPRSPGLSVAVPAGAFRLLRDCRVAAPIALPDPCTIVVRVQPWLPRRHGRRPCWRSMAGRPCRSPPRARFSKLGGRELQVAGADAEAALVRVADHRWRRAGCGCARPLCSAAGASPIPARRRWPARSASLGASWRSAPASPPTPGPHDNPYRAFFNGRIEDPAIIPGACDEAAPIEPEQPLFRMVGFQPGDPDRPHHRPRADALHGTLRNLPTRAVRGSRWTGEETNWRHAPRHYAAIHFHEDDLYDCGWETDFAVEIPDGHGVAASMACGCAAATSRTSCRSMFCRRPASRPRRSPFSPRPSPTRSTATTGAAMQTRRSARARRNGAPIRGTPTSTRNTAPRPTTPTPTAAASAIRACAGRS